ncbi:MAG TPA: SBBP repeat-containing protein [Bryobacteraceae bacterium]|nr:SBBP repeat-containing protein [Bryobacteraceae bacterium]
MRQKLIPFLVFLLEPLFAQTLVTHSYNGSGSDAANAITTDSSGNIYIAGTTTSFDLPLLNPSQSVNPGTQLLYSTNAGFSWKPLANLPDAFRPYQLSETMPIAVDPTNPEIFYLGSDGAIFRTTDGGQHFTSTRVLPSGYTDFTILIDRVNPSTLYAEVPTPGGIFKSTDAGATWSGAVLGLPAAYPGPMTIDPFHPQTLWLAINGGYYTTDGANTWSQAPLPAFTNGGVMQFVFDQAKPNTLYVIGRQNGNGTPFLLKSTDGGKNWTSLPTPFKELGLLVADPVHAGHLYLLSVANLFYRSADGGVTWQSFPFPSPYATAMAVDPGNTNIILAGSYRSNNGGETWSPTMPSRDIQMTFAPSGKDLVYASGPLTSDAFLAKFKPDGKTLEFATYFGGMGDETAVGIQLDAAGNIWIAGTTTSFDLPGAQRGFTQQLTGRQNLFLAKFTPQGELLGSTYLGGNNAETLASLKLDAHGDPWVFGQSTSTDFPPGISPSVNESTVFLAKIDSSASHLLSAVPVDGVTQAGGMTIDGSDNIILTGATNSSSFPVTPGVVHGVAPPSLSALKAYLIKLNPQGDTIFSTYLGGNNGADGSGIAVQFGDELENVGVAVATDSSGIYVIGNTSASDFPATSGAFQTMLKGSGCPYPALAFDTGMIGTIYSYLVDDVFVTKVSLDGKSTLYSTLLGGSCYDRPTDIAVTPSGAIFVTGETDSVDFPQVHPQQGPPAVQTYKSFVSLLSNDGSSLLYSSYVAAGSSPKLALDTDGMVAISGATGFGAQTQTYSGFPNPPANPFTKVLLGALNVSADRPALDLTSALNAFSLLPGPIAAGEIVELTVPDFKPPQAINIGLNERQPLGTSLGKTQVLFDGKPVPLIAISTGKIECIAPQEFNSNTTTSIQVNWNGKLSNALQEDVAPTALGLLSANASGTGAANARNQDGTQNSPSNPAKPGSRVTVFFTGAGNPPSAIGTQYGASVAPLHGFVPGIYSATFEIPSNANAESSPLGVTLYAPGGSIVVPGSSSQTLMVYVK